MEQNKDEIKYQAIVYWQDKLAKFFPTSTGPTNIEIEMFKAGYEYAMNNLMVYGKND